MFEKKEIKVQVMKHFSAKNQEIPINFFYKGNMFTKMASIFDGEQSTILTSRLENTADIQHKELRISQSRR